MHLLWMQQQPLGREIELHTNNENLFPNLLLSSIGVDLLKYFWQVLTFSIQ